MFARIQNRLWLQRWLIQTTQWMVWTGLLIGCVIVILHRLSGFSGFWMSMGLLLVPAASWVSMMRTPVSSQEVIRYAETVSGQSGLLWFASEVTDERWQKRVEERWAMVTVPELARPPELYWAIASMMFVLASLWVPLKSSTPYSPLVNAELAVLQDTLDQLDALTVDEDVALEEWREQIAALSEEEKVSSLLRQSEYLQAQMAERQNDMVTAIEEGMEALASGEQQSMTQAMKSLQEQGLIPKSAMNKEAMQQQNQSQLSTDGTQRADTDASSASSQQTSSQSQPGESGEPSGDSSAEQSGDQGQQNQQSGQPSAQQTSQQLQQQMSQIQQRLQQHQQQKQSSGGLKSMNNQQLQQLQERLTEQAQSGQEGQQGGQPGQSQSGQGQPGQSSANGQQGQNAAGEPCELGTPGCVPGRGGETAPLTYGAANSLPVSDGNLSSIQGVTEVDWNHNVYFGQGSGTFQGQAGQQMNDGTVASSTSDASFNNDRIPPNQRAAVQRFFSQPSNQQGVSNDDNSQP